MPIEFKLPELGENIESGDLVKVLVSVGEQIAKDQAVIELETEKATIEVPAPAGGRVKAIYVKEGEKVKVGQLILTVEDGVGAPAVPAEPPQPTAPEAKPAASAKAPPPAPPVQAEPRAPEPSAPPIEEPIKIAHIETTAAPPSAAPPPSPGRVAPAAPSVRRHARDLGIDINQVTGSGPGGRISAEDVTRFARDLIRGAPGVAAGTPAAAPLPDFSRWGAVERQPMSNIRRKTAEHLAHAWSAIPHVTQHDRADITRLEELRKQFAGKAESAGGKLTMTAIAVKVVAAALKVFPQFAAAVDVAASQIVYRKYCHIGVAVDTERGLLVPVIRDADRKNIVELAAELSRLAEKARTKKLAPDDMEGGVFTITNLGGIGG
ncbi:MAG TPA: 2-oxo acid dehydrogenase subunit E2, partial [Terriglobia bacterium]|nr:2-oxo acid dehydrogenase subunit E2 [Terriglobia bacterium]